MLLNVGLAVHNADWNWKQVNSPFSRLFYIIKGQAQIEMANGIHTLKEGYIYFIPAFTLHSYICDSHFELYYLHIYEELLKHSSLLEEWELPFETPGTSADYELFSRLCSMNPQMRLQGSDPATYDNNPTLIQNLQNNQKRALWDRIESRGIIFQLMAHLLRNATPLTYGSDSRIGEALLYIRRHITEPLQLEQLASKACVSKDHFIRLFKQEIGETPQKYINRKKIEQAQILLATSKIPVKNISYALGIDDYSYFNRLFKKWAGVSPQKYRDAYQ